ncbi:MAG: GAP family protein [Actinomycetia bacterium]|nr:GAP family protein [Actinomycetes bacterium]MCH9701990.1 GAP family protein [Actinomycetes bacterium]MCH9761744.1 GAP family protein [Actinomycetes bacterium]
MGSLWASLAPFAIAAALMPVEMVITLALLGTPGRVRTAGASVVGTVVVRLLQGLVFGTILHWGQRDTTEGGRNWVVSSIVLVVAVVLLVTAVRELLGGGDPDDLPPKWMAALSSMTPTRAFLLGAATALISVKMWVFTLAAISAIGAADMARTANFANYIAFVLLGVSTSLVIIAAAAFFPHRSAAFLDAVLRWLQKRNRVIMIALGLVFGGWFLYKGLHGLGVL